MLSRAVSAVLAVAFFVIAVPTAPAAAANLKLLAGSSMRTVLPDLLSQFEKSSGNKVDVEFGTLGANADRAAKGEGDVAIVTDVEADKLEKQGKLIAGSPVQLAKVGYGLLVKGTASRPDIGTVDAFKGTLLSAPSIAMGDPAAGGPVGVYTASLLQRLEVTGDVKNKTKLYPSGTQVAEAVAKGEAELGIGLVVVSGLTAIPLPD